MPIPEVPNLELPGIKMTTPKRRRRRRMIRKVVEIFKNSYYLWKERSIN